MNNGGTLRDDDVIKQLAPVTAAWRHLGARDGFEVVFIRAHPGGHEIEGHVTAVEAGEAWAVAYSISAAADWVTRRARVVARSAAGEHETDLTRDDDGHWLIDAAPAPELEGCADVDLEASVFTNALPVWRLGLQIGEDAEAPAAYVRAPGLEVERLEQSYRRIADVAQQSRYAYAAPRFDYTGELTYGADGLLRDYPGLAERII